MRLAERTALVTGGASGIGAATCRRLAAEGARVAVTDVNLDGARAIADEVDGAAFELDVRSTDSVRAAVQGAEQELGPVDVLVNNAGYDEWAWFTDTDEELWRRVLEVNLVGVIACTHALPQRLVGVREPAPLVVPGVVHEDVHRPEFLLGALHRRAHRPGSRP